MKYKLEGNNPHGNLVRDRRNAQNRSSLWGDRINKIRFEGRPFNWQKLFTI
uniref:Uncharacterized protein n=1 Tax=viral metagenome TaxID=1070528 RepID=A0A6C0JBC8_9ZZZZ